MGKLNVITNPNGIQGLIVIEPKLFSDSRGYFLETYNKQDLKKVGIDRTFVQDNQSYSNKGVLRGMHFQHKNPQAKLVRVVQGIVYDVAVDLRKESPTYGKYFGIVLSGDNFKQLFIPEGFAHGFLVLSDTAIFAYRCSEYYQSNDEYGILWNDERINIDWPILEEKIILSEKDKNSISLAQSEQKGLVF